MLVLPVTNFHKQNHISFNGGKRITTKPLHDIVELSGSSTQLFGRIRLRTAKKLYETDFALSGENWGKKSLSTFVFNRKKGKPEELFIAAYKFSDGAERYEFYRPETKYCQKLVGSCNINFYPEQKIVEPWFVYGNDKELRGIGFRCHQLAVERMLMEKYKNIVFKPDDLAYNFHVGAGFDVMKKGSIELPKNFYATGECVDKDFASFVEHIISKMPIVEKNTHMPEDCFLILPSSAKKDWEKIIEKQPILVGNNLEEFFYKGGSK